MSAFWNKFKLSKEEKEKDQEEEKETSDVSARPEKKTGEEKKDSRKGNDDKKISKDEKKDEKKDKKKDKKSKKVKKKKKKSFPKEKALLIERTVIRPKVSEAAMRQQTLNKYVFFVDMGATKNEVAKAVEAMYGVHVRKVNIQIYSQTTHRFKGFKGKKKGYKKAIVSLNAGETVDIFSE